MCGITASVKLVGQTKNAQTKSQLVDLGSGGANGVNGSKKQKVNGGDTRSREDWTGDLKGQLDKSLESIYHRGPDSNGTWISPDGLVGIGNCRLEINGLGPSGHQPFVNSDGSIHAVVNGELYDHKRTRQEMIQLSGYVFQGTSDSELAIALYQYYGTSFISRLRGEFALCIYDSNKQLFLAARDRSGIKPLFWTVFNDQLLLASEAKALLPFGWRPEWDVRSIMDLGWVTEERTIFKGLRKVRPGYCLTCISFDHISELQYWDHNYPDKVIFDDRSEENMIESVRARMLEAVDIRLQADVPVGIHLSGGIDSSVIAGMAKHLLDNGKVKLGSAGSHRLRCFGVAFDKDSGYDESDIAVRTAEHLGVQFDRVTMNEAELANNFEEGVWFDEQTHFDLGFIGKHVLSKLTRDCGIKTVLSGQGSDEIFGGYDVFLRDFLLEPDSTYPQDELTEDIRKQELKDTDAAMHQKFDKWTSAINPAFQIPSQSATQIPTFAHSLAIPYIAFAPWTSCYGAPSPQLCIIENIPPLIRDRMLTKWHPLHSAQYTWNKTALPNILLTNLGDRTEMSHSVEGRVPFLDHHLMEYVNGLPPAVKIRYSPASNTFIEKWILREASKPFITKELYERKKHPYSAPVVFPVGGPMHRLMERLVTRENVEALGFVDWSKTEGCVGKAFESGEEVALRSVLGLAQWVVLGKKFGIPRAERPMGM